MKNHDQDWKKKEFVKIQKILQEFGMKPDVLYGPLQID